MTLHVPQDVVDEMLECSGTVAKTKGHDETLVISSGSDEPTSTRLPCEGVLGCRRCVGLTW